MIEAQQSVGFLLSQMDQAGWLAGLVLGFTLGLITGLIIFYQPHVRA